MRVERHRRAGSPQVDEGSQKSSLKRCIPNPNPDKKQGSSSPNPTGCPHAQPPPPCTAPPGPGSCSKFARRVKLPLSVTIALAPQRGFTGLLLSR